MKMKRNDTTREEILGLVLFGVGIAAMPTAFRALYHLIESLF